MQNFYRLFNRFFGGLILFCFMVQASQTAHAQDVPWFENGSVYNFRQISAAFPPIPDPGVQQATIEAPVTFLGESCALLVPDEVLANLGACQPFMPPFYLREENDSVFYAMEDDEAFRFAYTFNAQVGDSWMYSMPVEEYVMYPGDGEFLFEVEVLETGSTTDESGNQNLRTLDLQFTPLAPEWYVDLLGNQGQYDLTVVEGVGGLSGFIIPIPVHPGWCDGDVIYFAVCMEGSAFNYRNPMFEACTIIGLEDVTAGGFNMYPNPAGDFVQLEALDGTAPFETAQVYNSVGASVHRQSLNAQNPRVDLEGLAPGIYHLLISDTENRLFSKTLIIQH